MGHDTIKPEGVAPFSNNYTRYLSMTLFSDELVFLLDCTVKITPKILYSSGRTAEVAIPLFFYLACF